MGKVKSSSLIAHSKPIKPRIRRKDLRKLLEAIGLLGRRPYCYWHATIYKVGSLDGLLRGAQLEWLDSYRSIDAILGNISALDLVYYCHRACWVPD